MVAKITFPKRLLAALNYNEKKVEKGAAQCIGSNYYLKEGPQLNFHQKLYGLQQRAELNDRSSSKTIHISLNFHPSEKLSPSTLLGIAHDYMAGIGFANQPYLVYQHRDAGHPHLHIVSTTIRENGLRILTHNIGKEASEHCRKRIEIKYGLKVAGGRKKSQRPLDERMNLSRLEYGKETLKSKMSIIIEAITNEYTYSSLAEYNAILLQYNLMADRGKEGSRTFQNKGLLFRVLNDKGEKIGVPVKASSLPGKPTLASLEKRFEKNNLKKEAFIESIKKKVDDCLQLKPQSLDELSILLGQKNIATVLRKASNELVYGITFVDRENKVVCNGSDIGRSYSAASLLKQLERAPICKDQPLTEKHTRDIRVTPHEPGKGIRMKRTEGLKLPGLESPSKLPHEPPPYGFVKKKKKKKKRN